MKRYYIISTILFSSVVAANGHFNENDLKKKRDSLTEQAADLKLSVDQYKNAVDQFYRLDFGDIHDLKKLNEYSEIAEAMVLLSQDQVLGKELNKKVGSIMKFQNKMYAKVLGIPESKTIEFIEYVKNLETASISGASISTEATKAGVISYATTYGFDDEIITITCNRQCQQQAGVDAFYKALYFSQWAWQSGVGQYQNFHVYYSANGESPESNTTEAWKYNNFSGAWKVGNISMCGDVVCKK